MAFAITQCCVGLRNCEYMYKHTLVSYSVYFFLKIVLNVLLNPYNTVIVRVEKNAYLSYTFQFIWTIGLSPTVSIN